MSRSHARGTLARKSDEIGASQVRHADRSPVLEHMTRRNDCHERFAQQRCDVGAAVGLQVAAEADVDSAVLQSSDLFLGRHLP